MAYILFAALTTTLWCQETVPSFRDVPMCPPVNAEIVDSNGECVYLCLGGKHYPCITGPFDDLEVLSWQ